ncbi:hypothetical protein CLPUN_31930 [Clostridium puniceum]|uniref:Uncharacterized protein n=1 Tax=Clostridium puniceum TaxID=29367 RepID=A0A1S8TD27_9CLOT|nr:hypothetical protein [Clostridium puniceum]OOM75522.1 hypothetical protein CLPUN_31930 [Clostridium puniceum]
MREREKYLKLFFKTYIYKKDGNLAMIIQRGKGEDVQAIIDIIRESIIDMESQEIFQGDNIYPNEDVINKDIFEGNIYMF